MSFITFLKIKILILYISDYIFVVFYNVLFKLTNFIKNVDWNKEAEFGYITYTKLKEKPKEKFINKY